MLRAVLFDWGDTLFHSPSGADVLGEAVPGVSKTDARRMWDELWAEGKSAAELAKGRDLSALAHREVWSALFARADHLRPGLGQLLYERVMDPAAWVPYPDTAPTLRALRQRGVRIGIVSNVPRDLRDIFAAHGLAQFVDAFTHSFEVGAEKPDPRIFLAACERLGVPPSDALMVGDHPIADAGAAAAGLEILILPDDGAPGLPRGLDVVVGRVDASRSAG